MHLEIVRNSWNFLGNIFLVYNLRPTHNSISHQLSLYLLNMSTGAKTTRRLRKPDWRDYFIVRKSRVEVDEETFGASADPGLGLFTKRPNSFITINFKGPNTVSIPATDCTDKQKKYQLDSGFDEDNRIVPTRRSLLSGFVDFYFFINHNSINPTHKLIWNDDDGVGFPQLLPLRKLGRDEEITFDYNYK